VKSLPTGTRRLTKQEIDDLFSPTALRAIVPENGVLLSAKRISFDDLPGGLVDFKWTADRMGEKYKLHGLTYSGLFQDKVITLHFATPDDDSTFARFRPLFQLIAESVVVMNRYE
jgi:hypothetical protein